MASDNTSNTPCGAIYILTNPAFPGLVKIGYADDPFQRLHQLNSHSGTPAPFYVYATYDVYERVSDKKIHSMIDMLNPDLRYNRNREFFTLSPQQAYDILYTFAFVNGLQDNLHYKPYDGQIYTGLRTVQDGAQAVSSSQLAVDDNQSLTTWCEKFVVENRTFHSVDTNEAYEDYKGWAMRQNHFIVAQEDFIKYIRKAYGLRLMGFTQPYTGASAVLFISRDSAGKINFKHTFPQSFLDWANQYLEDNSSFHKEEQESVYNDYSSFGCCPIMPYDTFIQALCEKYNLKAVSNYTKDKGLQYLFVEANDKPVDDAALEFWASTYLEEHDSFHMIRRDVVYEDYLTWAKEQKITPLGKTAFVRAMNKMYGLKVELKYHPGYGTIRTFVSIV